MPSPRPAGIAAGPHTRDDGLYGPGSITWRVVAHPSVGLAGAAAAMIQMLYPPVMHVIDQASGVREDLERRAQRTGDYTATITFGDTATAEHAGEMLRRLHSTRKAVDPETGRQLRADDPELLNWVHESLTWTMLRSYETYGPGLTPAERDRFVAEQRAAARLVGCDPDAVAGTDAELEAAMAAMEPRLAFSTPCLWFRDMMVPPSLPRTPGDAVKRLMAHAAVCLMSPTQRELYGYRTSRLRLRATVAIARALIAGPASKVPLERAVPQLREYVDTHAFGARRRRAVVPDPVPAVAGDDG